MSILKDTAIELVVYATESGELPFSDWLNGIKDKRSKMAIRARLARVQAGNFGDCKPLREGVSELRVQYGPGFRVYYSQQGPVMVLLLSGGDKSGQDKDIESAIAYLKDWKERTKK